MTKEQEDKIAELEKRVEELELFYRAFLKWSRSVEQHAREHTHEIEYRTCYPMLVWGCR